MKVLPITWHEFNYFAHDACIVNKKFNNIDSDFLVVGVLNFAFVVLRLRSLIVINLPAAISNLTFIILNIAFCDMLLSFMILDTSSNNTFS